MKGKDSFIKTSLFGFLRAKKQNTKQLKQYKNKLNQHLFVSLNYS